MNGYYHYQEQGDDYGMHCPYRDTCPMRAQCPYCPYQMEENGWMNPGYYGNMSMNMPMEHSLMGNPEPILCPYQNMPWEEYGYENLYPMANNAIVNKGMRSYNHYPKSPEYNRFGYVGSEENINSPWANNQMFGHDSTSYPYQ